jgi:anti-sigma regulatory factor (Ser/Thr protein kinase)
MNCAAVLDNLDQVNGFLEECAESFGIGGKRKFGLLLAVEEAFVNICNYAYPAGRGDVEIACSGDAKSFAVEIADGGVEFDILSLPDPDTTTDLMDREVGGLGVFFIRKLTDDLSYRREKGRNILRMVLHPPKDGATS